MSGFYARSAHWGTRPTLYPTQSVASGGFWRTKSTPDVSSAWADSTMGGLLELRKPACKDIKFLDQTPENRSMQRLFIAIITIICSWLGWWVGDQIGLMTAFILSMIGTGLGIYFGKRLIQF